MTHLGNATLHSAEEGMLVYLIKAADVFVNTEDNNSSFHSLTFFKYGNTLLRELRVFNNSGLVAQKKDFGDLMRS